MIKSGEMIKNPVCPSRSLWSRKKTRKSLNASLSNKEVLLRGMRNCCSVKKTSCGSSAKRVRLNLLDSTHTSSDSRVVCKTICRASPTSDCNFSFILSRANQARADTRVIKQPAKIIKMLNFWMDPCSAESRPLLTRFKRHSKNTSRPVISTAMATSKNSTTFPAGAAEPAQAHGTTENKIIKMKTPHSRWDI